MSHTSISSESAEGASDDWLAPWREFFRGGRTALDVGCGPGYDTERLLSWGFTVSACDISAEALALATTRNPHASHRLADARDLSAYSTNTFDVVVASLSLHYFNREDTLRAFAGIARVSRPSGVFAFRVNADDDHAFGAPIDGRPWELTSYRGKPKQFFTFEMVHEALSGHFTPLVLEKRETHRYGHKKSYIAALTLHHTAARSRP